jgi:hypothetical protein
MEIFRANGIGPVSNWVDNHLFFQIQQKFLDEYNPRGIRNFDNGTGSANYFKTRLPPPVRITYSEW